ncbi:hypothetical protein HAX54_026690 [Datura stramonium]|uniref:Uncharacterized protein n=1 Tax=Datura stramonium TaxID=4076 RepID=A0ABS8V1C4_DATST|nr:hypothetical protein [Datura stramonium]
MFFAESPPVSSPKQSIVEAATAISEGKIDVAGKILTRLAQVANVRGSSEQRLTTYMVSALRSRLNSTKYPPPVLELLQRARNICPKSLRGIPVFLPGFMAANLAILEAVADQISNKLHVIDFDIGQGGQYLHLLHALATKKTDKPASLKITAITEEKLGVEHEEALAVNFAYRLSKLPDESVTTENLRDERSGAVKGLSPKVVTVVEQELNGNTAAFAARKTRRVDITGIVGLTGRN